LTIERQLMPEPAIRHPRRRGASVIICAQVSLP
jgi:hypothetical protein